MAPRGARDKMVKSKNQNGERGEVLEGEELAVALRGLITTPLVASLSDAELSTLRGNISIKSYRAGAIVVKHGEIATCCFIIIRGKLAARRLDLKGKELTYKLLEPGELFG